MILWTQINLNCTPLDARSGPTFTSISNILKFSLSVLFIISIIMIAKNELRLKLNRTFDCVFIFVNILMMVLNLFALNTCNWLLTYLNINAH